MPTSHRHHRALRAYEQAPLQPMRRPSLADRVGAAVGRRCCAVLDRLMAGAMALRRASWGDVIVPVVGGAAYSAVVVLWLTGAA